MISLITGGAGFIGSHLCDALLQKDHTVLCIDNLITGDLKNISHLKNNKKFEFKKWDVRIPLIIESKIDFIYHLASPASPIDYQNYPLETLLTNSEGTHNILELAKKNKAKFLLASTSEVYGDPKIHPQKEDYWGNVNPVGPRSCYDEAKRFAESITTTYIKKLLVDGRIIRIFNTYGPRMQKDDGRVISNFINQALEDKPITVYGKGNHTRSFCYVDDLVIAIIKALESKNTKGEIINLGNPNEITILEIANKIKTLINSKSEIIFKPLPTDDPTKRCPDINKAKRILNWEPKTSLNEGLVKTIKYFSE